MPINIEADMKALESSRRRHSYDPLGSCHIGGDPVKVLADAFRNKMKDPAEKRQWLLGLIEDAKALGMKDYPTIEELERNWQNWP